MAICRMEGIILHLLKIGDFDQLLTIFTREAGVIKVMFRGGRDGTLKCTGGGSCASPLTRVEVVYTVGRGELYRGRELTRMESYQTLRQDLSQLNAGCALLEAIRRSQIGEKPVPLLYSLLCLYLNRLTDLSDPGVAVASFYLKILKHEGLIGADCVKDLPEEEQLLMEFLAGCRNFADLELAKLAPDCLARIRELFVRRIS